MVNCSTGTVPPHTVHRFIRHNRFLPLSAIRCLHGQRVILLPIDGIRRLAVEQYANISREMTVPPPACGRRTRPALSIIKDDWPKPCQADSPSAGILRATQDVCDHLAQRAGRVTDLIREFDVDRNGSIGKREFFAMCLSLGVTFPSTTLEQVFDILDARTHHSTCLTVTLSK